MAMVSLPSLGNNDKVIEFFQLPPLAYPYEALEPFIDAQTMRLHHDQHHQAYVDNLNRALQPYPELKGQTIEDLLRGFASLPEPLQLSMRNQGGGHANHQFFWKIIGPPRDTRPEGRLAEAIESEFGSLENLQEKFTQAAMGHFGSGWAFLVINPETKKLELLTLPNQDSVLLHKRPGLLACDLWEHAYYLNYQNRRADYLKAWWQVVAWDVVSRRLDNFYAGKKLL